MKKGQGFARRVTIETLEKFAALLRRKADPVERSPVARKMDEEKVETDPAFSSAEALFSGTPIKTPIYPSTPKKTDSTDKLSVTPTKTDVDFPRKISPITQRGQLLWQKENLPRSDAQQTRSGTAPTGGLRLVQANWNVNDQIINQTIYFRYEVFGKLNWTVGSYHPKKRETVRVSFDIKILGKDYGVWNLVISHKPTGEAGQGNYTTLLHWGDLANIIRELDLTGRTFQLYAPPEGQEEPFFIEII